MPPRLYTTLAPLWPLLSPPSDYAPEAEHIRHVLRARLPATPAQKHRPTLLELGAGGGHTLCHLVDEFDAAAVDVSAPMLDNCRRLIEGLAGTHVETIVADMRTVRLGRTFDAVLAHDAIDYMLTEADLRAAFATAAAHLEPGGVFLVAPTYTRDEFRNHDAAADHHAAGGIETTLITHVIDPDPADTVFDMTLLMLIREHGGLRIEEDRHVCGLFDEATWLRLLDDAGFDAAVDAEECADGDAPPFRLFVAVRR